MLSLRWNLIVQNAVMSNETWKKVEEQNLFQILFFYLECKLVSCLEKLGSVFLIRYFWNNLICSNTFATIALNRNKQNKYWSKSQKGNNHTFKGLHLSLIA